MAIGEDTRSRILDAAIEMMESSGEASIRVATIAAKLDIAEPSIYHHFTNRAALVEEAVSVGDVVRLFSFRKGQANLVELTLPDGSACIGKTVEEIELPENAALAAIVRDGRVITAKAHDVFAAGDELLFVASADAEALIKSCFIS